MKIPAPHQEALRPSSATGALRSSKTKPLAQEQIENAILDYLAGHGPSTAGEIGWKLFDGTVRAAVRDQAIASLVKRRHIVAGDELLEHLHNRWVKTYQLAPKPRTGGGEP